MQALIIIDMQRWMFRTPDRAAQLDGLVPQINRLAHEFEVAGRPIFEVRTSHKADRGTWSRLMLKYDHACLIEGTDDVCPIDGLVIPRSARHVSKTANSAFMGTDLDDRLRREGVNSITLCGVFMDGCVGLSAADAAQLGYGVTLAANCIGYIDANHNRMMAEWLNVMFETSSE